MRTETGNGSSPGTSTHLASQHPLQVATFMLNGEMFGIEILQVQEIQLPQQVTPVPRAPAHVLGLISLRGQIITLIDLRKRLGMTREKPIGKPFHIVINTAHHIACFEVDEIGDVIDVPPNEFHRPPDSIKAIDAALLRGVHPMKHCVLSVLDVEKVVETN